MTGHVGTLFYMSPESMKNTPYTQKGDVYSFGIIMWELFTEQRPYSTTDNTSGDMGDWGNVMNLGFQVCSGARPDLPEVASEKEQEYINLMVKCWDGNPEARPTFTDIFPELEKLFS
jgi:serine/threonine protein kinase